MSNKIDTGREEQNALEKAKQDLEQDLAQLSPGTKNALLRIRLLALENSEAKASASSIGSVRSFVQNLIFGHRAWSGVVAASITLVALTLVLREPAINAAPDEAFLLFLANGMEIDGEWLDPLALNDMAELNGTAGDNWSLAALQRLDLVLGEINE